MLFACFSPKALLPLPFHQYFLRHQWRSLLRCSIWTKTSSGRVLVWNKPNHTSSNIGGITIRRICWTCWKWWQWQVRIYHTFQEHLKVVICSQRFGQSPPSMTGLASLIKSHSFTQNNTSGCRAVIPEDHLHTLVIPCFMTLLSFATNAILGWACVQSPIIKYKDDHINTYSIQIQGRQYVGIPPRPSTLQ